MKRLCIFTCLLLLVDYSQAAVVTSNSSGGGSWSLPGTWAEGVVPRDADSVVIAAGDTVIFDVDTSAWPNGLAGITIDAVLQASTEAGHYYLKTCDDIVLGPRGQLNAGTAEAAYPLSCTFTIDFDDGPDSIECGKGGTIHFYCAQPTTAVIALSEAAAPGATELKVDTSVMGDTWFEGATVRVDDVDKGLDSEERIITAGGVAVDTIRLTQGLANAKIQGAKVILITRNVRIVGSTDYAIRSVKGGVLGCEISGCARGIYAGVGCDVTGTVSGCVYGISETSESMISGVVSGCTYGIAIGAGCKISGMVSGCSYGISYGAGHTIFGMVSGCNYGIIYSFGNAVSGTVSGCSSGFSSGTGNIEGATFSGNRYDLRRLVSLFASNTLFDSTIENLEFNTSHVPPKSYVASYDHDAVPGAFKAWTRGGVVVSDVDMVLEGYGVSYKHICENAAMPCFRQEEITVGPNQTLWVEGKMRISDDHSAWAPRLEIIDAGLDPLVDAKNAALASNAIPVADGSLADWQDVIVSYTNTSLLGKRVLVRCSAQRAEGEVFEVWNASLQ
jgi:hypothetical protein